MDSKRSIKLNNFQSLALEIKLNKTVHSKEWSALGNILYSWQLSPSLYKITSPLTYTITDAQMDWIISNIDHTYIEPFEFTLNV
jgi:hypothetical protein